MLDLMPVSKKVSRVNQRVRNLVFEPKVKFLLKITQPVFIWSMEKVGSTSVARALYSVKGTSVFTSHFMNDPEHPRSQVIYRNFIEPRKPLQIITLVRDPISKNISSLFQNYEKNTGYIVIGIEL